MKYYKSYEDFNTKKIEDGDEIYEGILSSIFSDIKSFFTNIFNNIKVDWEKLKKSIKSNIYSEKDVNDFERDLDVYKEKNHMSDFKLKDMESFLQATEKNDTKSNPDKVTAYKSIANDIGNKYKQQFVDNEDLKEFKEDFAKFFKVKKYTTVDSQSLKDFISFAEKYIAHKYPIYNSIYTLIKTGELKIV